LILRDSCLIKTYRQSRRKLPMKKSTISLSSILLVGIVGLYLAGCATGPTATAPAKTMPQMVQEAGFRGFPAGTDKEMAHLQVCPRDTLMIHEGKTARCYAFADPASKTMYIGDEAAYRRLQGLLDQQQQKIREERIEDDPQFWPMWGSRWGGG
jgi:hypothetical protein